LRYFLIPTEKHCLSEPLILPKSLLYEVFLTLYVIALHSFNEAGSYAVENAVERATLFLSDSIDLSAGWRREGCSVSIGSII